MENTSRPRRKRRLCTVVLIILAVLAAAVIAVAVFLKNVLTFSCPALEGQPEVGTWYAISPDGAKSSDGSEWHGLLRLGHENKVLVYFYGGGVSLTEETSRQQDEWFFIPTVALQDHFISGGIFTNEEKNPFRDWTFLAVEYSTGDFHCGTGEYHYTDDSGLEKTVYHNGYNNYAGFIEEAKKYIGAPDTMVVAGSSAGGFATALLTDDLIDRIPSAENVTICVDSALLHYDDWRQTAQELWKAPETIYEKLTTDNIVLDSLTHLRQKRGDGVKILFTSSVRDHDLQRYQAYIRDGRMESSQENSALYQRDLAKMVADMQELLPGSGFYIWEYGMNPDDGSTQHMILPSNVFDKLQGEKSAANWLIDAVNGDVRSYGLELLEPGA